MRGSHLPLAFALALGCAHTPVEPEPRAPARSVAPTAAPVATTDAPPASSPAPPSTSEASLEDAGPPAPAPERPRLPETGYDFQRPLPPRELARDAPASVFANLSPAACSAELRRRKLPVERDGSPAAGIATPVRITGEMHGVRFRPPGRKSVYGKLDCRLALAFDELARVLERHGVTGARIDNLYRPRARLPGRRTHSQHRYGLAIDLVSLERAGRSELSVERDWHGPVGSPPCGPDARVADPTPEALALRDIVCDVARSGLFHHLLTPSYDEAHRDHLHLDIKRGEKRWIIR